MNILETIAAKTRERTEAEKKQLSLETVRNMAEEKAAAEKKEENGQFTYRFQQALAGKDIILYCEVKKASPSKGIIAEAFPYLQIAREYEQAGASAISCLTEPFWFLGKDEYLKEITGQVQIPVLRKDFTIDEYMIYQAKNLGASAILLICAILDDGQLAAWHQLAAELGLSVLTEAHTEEEIDRALKAGAKILGVNNRNLKDFTVDVEQSRKLRSMVSSDVLFVSESRYQESCRYTGNEGKRNRCGSDRGDTDAGS